MTRLVRKLATLTLLGAAACSSDDLSKAIDYGCPRVVVLADASTVTVFTPGAPESPENVMFTAHIANTSAECNTTKNLVIANVAMAIKVNAGPAPLPGPMQLPFFLAATEYDTRVTGKVVRNLDVVIPPGVPTVEAVPHFDGIQIPIAEGNTSRNYEIVVGFQLTPDQVRYNRTPRP